MGGDWNIELEDFPNDDCIAVLDVLDDFLVGLPTEIAHLEADVADELLSRS